MGRRPPRVVIIVQNLPVPRDVRVWAEARALAEFGYDVSVICPQEPNARPFEVLEGVRLYKYLPPRWTQGLLGLIWEALYSWIRIAGKVARLRFKGRIDVLQACNPPDTFFPLGALVKLTGGKFLFDQHDICPELYTARFDKAPKAAIVFLKALEGATYRIADHVLSVNESCREIALNRGRRKPEFVTVVRNGPPMAAPDKVPVEELKRGRKYLCCYVGMMNPQDGVDLAILAIHEYVHRLKRTDTHFAFLGDGDSLPYLKDLAAERNLSEWITFTGWATRDVVGDYLATGDLGLAPEPRNEMNDVATIVKVLEYMAASLPVVAFDLKETRVSAGDAAIYAAPNDPHAFARSIAALLDDDEKRRSMTREGRARIEGHLAWEHQRNSYLNVFAQLTRA